MTKLFACVAFALLPASALAQTTDVAIVDVTVLPMTNVGRLLHQTVVTRGDRIVAVGPKARVRVPAAARRIDGRGKVLMPGLVDMHVHLSPTPGNEGDAAQRSLAVMLANGVTTVRGMAGSPANLTVRDKIEAGTVPGPRFYVAAPALHDKNTSTVEQARKAVQAAKAAKFDLIKSHSLSNVAVWEAVQDEARQQGVPTAGHVTNEVGLDRALRAGEQIEHLDGTLPQLAPQVTEQYGQFPTRAVLEVAAKASDADLNRLARRVAAAKSWQVPTVSLFEKVIDTATPTSAFMARPEMRFVPDAALKQWAAQREEMVKEFTPPQAAAFRDVRRRIVAAYRRAGVRMMVGSDTAQAFHLWGFGVHEEMRSLVTAGLTPMEALRAATVNGRDYFRSLPNGGSSLGWKAEFGTVERGARADLVLLSGDPSRDLRTLAKPEAVIAGGRFYDRARLDALLEKAAADAHAAK